MCRHKVPTFMASASCIKKRISLSPKKKKIRATTAKKQSERNAVRHTDFSARSGIPAPRFCPTKVAAAFARPQAGKIVKMHIRIAVPYPAVAVSPDSAIIFARKIQLQLPIINWNIPPAEVLRILRIIEKLALKCFRANLINDLPLNK